MFFHRVSFRAKVLELFIFVDTSHLISLKSHLVKLNIRTAARRLESIIKNVHLPPNQLATLSCKNNLDIVRSKYMACLPQHTSPTYKYANHNRALRNKCALWRTVLNMALASYAIEFLTQTASK